MIDEDLYQQATDELNSDKRRPHIWARACALASDDHDEARYLYTNLRVEELIAERDASGVHPSSDAPHSTGSAQDATLTLEPLDLTEDIPESISAPSGIDQGRGEDEILTLNSAMMEGEEVLDSIERKSFGEKFETDETPGSTEDQGELEFSDEYLDETINLTSELDGTAVFELDKSDASEFDNNDLTDDDSGAFPDKEEEDELEALLGGIYHGSAPPPPTDPLADDDTGAAMTMDFSDVTGSHVQTEGTLDESLEWLEGELSLEENSLEMQQYTPATTPVDSLDDSERRLAQELERQADELTGQRSDIVAVNEDLEDDDLLISAEHEIISGDTFDEEAERDIAESIQRKLARQNPSTFDDEVDDSLAQHDLEDEGDDDEHLPERETVGTSALPAAAAMAAAGVAAASDARVRSIRELPVDLSEQHAGTRYTIFRRGDQAQAVKNGVSWPALFLTLPYLVYRHLFGTALVYGALWLIVLAGLLISGLAWLDAGAAASSVLKFSTIGFAALALIGLFFLPFRYCNQWREAKLEQRGFELVAWVRASSPGKAISAARRASALD